MTDFQPGDVITYDTGGPPVPAGIFTRYEAYEWPHTDASYRKVYALFRQRDGSWSRMQTWVEESKCSIHPDADIIRAEYVAHILLKGDI